jgi:hypothetical protein
MRPRLRYNKEDIFENLFTTGSEWMTTDTVEYKGVYHRYSDGTVLTLGTYDPKLSRKLIPFQAQEQDTVNERRYRILKTDQKTKYQSPAAGTTLPTETDINKGFFKRYYIEKFDGQIFEITKHTYKLYTDKKIDPNLYKAVELNWTIKGPLRDETVGNVTTLSVENTNRKAVTVAARTCPSLLKFITNYIEFAIIGNIQVPADINE